MRKKTPFRNSLIITGTLAVFSIGFSLYSFTNLQKFLKNSEYTKGVIVGFEKQRKVFKPIVEFKDKEQQKYTFTASIGSSDTLQVKTGSQVKVLYHRYHPKNASLDDFWHLWQPTLMILLFGVLPLLFILLLRFILVPPTQSY